MIKFTRFTLDNGLRVINNYDPSTSMVAMTVLYNVGSRDESPELTGLAHLFEHLMFGGSVNIPDFDGSMERAGGWNNAWTSNDFTCFYDVAPAMNVETLFWLESDRMLSPSFTPKSLEVQRNVVIEEFKQVCLNKPYGDLTHRLRELIYTVHPYRYPTIGKEIAHIEKASRSDIEQFFFSHYAPNNATVALSGNVTDEQACRLAHKWFGPIERRVIAPRLYKPEPPIDHPRHLQLTGNVPQAVIVKAYPMPGYGCKGYIESDIITDILSAGRSSRFYRRLVMGSPLFTEADASIIGSEEPGFIMVNARLSDDSDETITRASAMLDSQVAGIADGRFTDYELQRALNGFESNFEFSTLSYLNKSQQLATCEMHNEDINDTVPRYRMTTRDDVIDVARRVLDPGHSATLVYRPQKSVNDNGSSELTEGRM